MKFRLSGVVPAMYYSIMHMPRLSRQDGFTLPELVVAFLLIAAVGALAMVLLHQNPRTVERHNYQRKTDEAFLMQGLTRYYYDN